MLAGSVNHEEPATEEEENRIRTANELHYTFRNADSQISHHHPPRQGHSRNALTKTFGMQQQLQQVPGSVEDGSLLQLVRGGAQPEPVLPTRTKERINEVVKLPKVRPARTLLAAYV